MPKQQALIDYQKCHPEQCQSGICLAAEACPRQLMTQEEPYEKPDPPMTMCLGCAVCTQACPSGAVMMM